MRHLAGDVLGREPDAVIPWTGRRMATEFAITAGGVR